MNIGQGRATVTTPGTPVALGGQQRVEKLIIVAETNNTNPVVVGGEGVIAAIGTREGVPLDPSSGESRIELCNTDLSRVFIDAVTATEGVTFTYLY